MSERPTWVADIELSDRDYEFDLFGVFKGTDGWYTATDQGCSCPIPWELHNKLDDFSGPYTLEQVIEKVRKLEPLGAEQTWFMDEKRRMIERLRSQGEDG